ncbi:MAG: response regulator [Desulfobulbaceae bacterium]|nr:response regulator [Desulfobulbaceae bacterium]
MTKINVLVVDDEVDFATSLAERLKLRNFNCQVSLGGTEALQMIKEGLPDIPDVVVLDLKMPDISGLDVLSEIKKKYPGIQVIMLTGHGSISNGIRGMDSGAFDYLMKPFDINELEHKIRLATKNRSSSLKIGGTK